MSESAIARPRANKIKLTKSIIYAAFIVISTTFIEVGLTFILNGNAHPHGKSNNKFLAASAR